MIKQFLLFMGDVFYPKGGWEDFHSSYDDAEDAIGVGVRTSEIQASRKWFQVVDRISGEIIHQEEKHAVWAVSDKSSVIIE